MIGELNKNPIKDTFLLGTRFPNRKSLAICLDSVRSQEYFEIVSSLYKKNSYQYDYVIFTADNNSPALLNPCGLYYFNSLEYYRGDVLALTIRSAINVMQSGSIFEKKVWHISDLTGFKEASGAIENLFSFFDEIVFVNEKIRNVFFSFFPAVNKSKTHVFPMDIMSLDSLIL